MSDPSAAWRVSGPAGYCRFLLIRSTIPLQQPFSDSPGRQPVIAVVSEDPIQGMGISPASFPFPLPLTPPEQRTGSIGAGLTPAESPPGCNGFESVAVQRQEPVAAHPGVHIHEPLPQVGEISIRNSLALGHASQSQRLRFSVMQHRPGGESIQQARQPSPAAFLRMVLKHQDRVVFLSLIHI